jgi:Flp pilus assembly protein TadD
MRSTFTAVGLVLLGTLATSTPALAQKKDAATTPAAQSELCPGNLSNGARKALIDLKTAVDAKNAATFATADAAARAAVKNADDRCILAQLELSNAANASDYAGAATAVEALLASGVANKAMVVPILNNIGKNRFNGKDYAGASQAFERALQLAPNDSEQMMLLAETRAKTGQADAAIALYRKAVAASASSGVKIKEDYIKHAVAFAYESKNPQTYDLAREWVAAYPSSKNWRDAIKVYTVQSGIPANELLDMWRLQRATKSLTGEADFARYAQSATNKGLGGEAKAVLEEGFASNAISRTSAVMSSLYKQAGANLAGDRASLGPAATKALAAAVAKPAMTTADALYGYGEYAKAAELYRAAATKTGADVPLANLRLGIALTMAGDKAGAKAALEAVSGPKAEQAKYWLTYLAQRP